MTIEAVKMHALDTVIDTCDREIEALKLQIDMREERKRLAMEERERLKATLLQPQ